MTLICYMILYLLRVYQRCRNWISGEPSYDKHFEILAALIKSRGKPLSGWTPTATR